MQKQELLSKVLHLNLDLDYPVENCPPDIQTNALISRTINNFYNLYKDNISTFNVVYEYRDDCTSYVGLKLVEILAEYMNFNFEILGKVKKFKTKERVRRSINEKELTKKENVLLISNFNPIYKVGLEDYSSKKVSNGQIYNIMEHFTPDEILVAFTFYGGTYEKIDKNDVIKNPRVVEFGLWANTLNPKGYFPELETKQIENEIIVNMVYITGKTEIDMKTLQDVEQSNIINFYFYKEEKNLLFDPNFQAYVSKRTNIPSNKYKNLNPDLNGFKGMISVNKWYGKWPLGTLMEQVYILGLNTGGIKNEDLCN